MASLCIDNTIIRERKGWSTLYYQRHREAPVLWEIGASAGDIIKSSKKSRVRRVSDYVVKESLLAGGAGPAKHTFQRGRYRRGWFAAHHLLKNGVLVPEPIAFIERGCLGLVTGNAMVSRFLSGQKNVEAFLGDLIGENAGADTIHLYLGAMANAINQLRACGAYHGDLSGKNIFTADGRRFTFIDLDDVTLDAVFSEEDVMKNHVQLYDSFCDVLSDSIMVPFLEKILPPEADIRVWMPKVRGAQRARREAVEERWAREEETR